MTRKRNRKTVSSNTEASETFTRRLPYLPCKNLLTPGERRFYHDGLHPAVGDRYLIAMKVRLADIVTVEEHDWRRKHGRQIAQKHVDFVLATKKATRIVAAVELNDSSHDAEERQVRDAFVADALRVAGVPLVGFPIYRRYDPVKIRRHILAVVKNFQG